MLVVDEAAADPEVALERNRGRVGALRAAGHLLGQSPERPEGPQLRRVRGAEQVVDAGFLVGRAEQLRIDALLDLAVLALGSKDRRRVDRLRPGELRRRRRGRVALNVVGVALAQEVQRLGDAGRVVTDPVDLRAEMDGRAGSDEPLVTQPHDRHLLGQPSFLVSLPCRDQPVLAEHGGLEPLRSNIFLPASLDDRVEDGRPPVLRRRARLDLQHGRWPLREREAVVAGVPDVRDVDGLGRVVVRVPVLPVEERVLGERGRARGGDGGDDDERPGGQRGAETAQRPPPERHDRHQHARQEERAAQEVVARKQRPGPAHADDEPDRGETRPPRRRREPDPEREGEERDQEHAVHARMRARVERHLHVVEVEEAAPEAREDPAGEAPAEGELERAGGGDQRNRHAAAGARHERRQKRQRDHERRLRRAGAVLEPQPAPGEQGRRERPDQQRPRHGRPPRPPPRRAVPPGRRRCAARPWPPRPPGAAAAPGSARAERRRSSPCRPG